VFDLGIRLQILVGPTLPLPAPLTVADAFVSATVRSQGAERDGFQLELSLTKDAVGDYPLFRLGLFDPPNRVVLVAWVGVAPTVLIDGVATDVQVAPGAQPGAAKMVVTGEDLSLLMDLEEKSAQFPGMADFLIVNKVLLPYLRYGVAPTVIPTTSFPLPTARIPTQQETDLALVTRLARQNGYVFYLQPTAPGVVLAHWGPENRVGLPQKAITVDMGGDSNVESPPAVAFNALAPVAPQTTASGPGGVGIPLPAPPSGLPPLALSAARPLRKTLNRPAGRLSQGDATQQAKSEVVRSADAVTVTGELDVARYGRPLLPRQLVGLRGVGVRAGGLYYVRQVTHNLSPGRYTQSYTLVREGLGATTPAVIP
jgi:hypothetical protein